MLYSEQLNNLMSLCGCYSVIGTIATELNTWLGQYTICILNYNMIWFILLNTMLFKLSILYYYNQLLQEITNNISTSVFILVIQTNTIN